MLKAILSRTISKFERTWNYDASYMRDLLNLGSAPFIQFGMVASLGHRREVPAAAMAAAGIVGTLAADCGPCTPIGGDMARADPLRDEIIARWGDKALVAIGLALTTARMYPTLKYALGHGRTCSKVVVAGAPAPFQRLEPLAA
jgi:hypothetical protein